MSDGIITATRGAVLEVTIDRPKANAIDLAASRRLNEVFSAFRDDPALRVAIVTGAGERFFSPGWDLKAAAAGEQSDEDWGAGGFGGLNYPRNLDKPLIAAVNGIACGGGFEIVLGTDIIVMEEHARFALPEIKHHYVLPHGAASLGRNRVNLALHVENDQLAGMPERVADDRSRRLARAGRGEGDEVAVAGVCNQFTGLWTRALGKAVAVARGRSAPENISWHCVLVRMATVTISLRWP